MARPQCLVHGLGESVADLRCVRMIDLFEQPLATLQVVGDGRERLVDLVRERGGHLAHGGQARQPRKLGLQLLELVLGLLPLSKVADESGEEAPVAGAHLADRELHGEGRAILALTGDDAVDADDALLAGGEVARDIAVMLLAKRTRHQHAHIAADDRVLAIAEQALGGGAEGLHDAVLVDHDGRVRHGVEDRAEPRFAHFKRRGVPAAPDARAAKLLAEPRDEDADDREQACLDERGAARFAFAGDERAECHG